VSPFLSTWLKLISSFSFLHEVYHLPRKALSNVYKYPIHLKITYNYKHIINIIINISDYILWTGTIFMIYLRRYD